MTYSKGGNEKKLSRCTESKGRCQEVTKLIFSLWNESIRIARVDVVNNNCANSYCIKTRLIE